VIISFKNWKFSVDREATERTYASFAVGSAEECGCIECANYLATRESIFPDEIKLLLNELGIDFKKEAEVWRMYKNQKGNHCYNGIFHFKGCFDGEDCAIPMPDGKGFTFSLNPITDRFSIGFRMASELSNFTDTNDLVQVEYEIEMPWAIDKKAEPEW